MRKHGWQLPYHPLQVVAIAVFLALGFAFYVFFLPFVGKKVLQYVVMGMYTPLAICAFSLYICCAATNPGDPGVFKSKKYVKAKRHRKGCNIKDFREESLITEVHTAKAMNKMLDDDIKMDVMGGSLSQRIEKSSEQKTSEDGMFYCCLCEVEVRKHSKHCRVCDKCVDHFDHHCRWLNNCIGRKNYGRFFVLMISAILLLILQWSIGVLVLILCFLDRKRYSVEITSKLGSSFSLAPFTVVVASCTFLAMLATLPLTQLFFFHVLLIKKGISTYEYIVALREQEQQGVGQQSPRMSSVSSLTGFSSASSFNAFQRGSWCTPPRLFLEDESDAIPQEINTAVNSDTKKMAADEPRKRSAGNIKISPWTLSRLNPEEASNAAARARKNSKILQPIAKQAPLVHETDARIGRTNTVPKPEQGRRLPEEISPGSFSRVSVGVISGINGEELDTEATGCLPPLQLEARSAFRSNRASSPDSSLDSPHLHPFRMAQGTMSVASAGGAETQRGVEFLRSSSDGYEASGGEDSDIVPSRIVHRSVNWSSLIFSSDRGEERRDCPS